MNFQRCVTVAATLGVLACGLPTGSTPDGGGTNPQADEDQYRALTASLEQKRTKALGKQAMEIAAVGDRLFWLEFPTFDPRVHSMADATGARVDYGFSIGTGNDYNYRASKDLVVTALRSGNQVTYTAWRADQPAAKAGELTVDAPNDGQKWWAYAVDGGDVYYVRTGPAELWKWTPSAAGASARQFAFADAGVAVGIFQEFAVENGLLVFVESGRIWKLDLATRKATFLRNTTQVDGTVWFDTGGILFTTATGPFYQPLSGADLVDVAAKIKASTYRLNATYATAHLWYQDAALGGDRIVYVAQSGVFALKLATGEVSPVLLTPHLDNLRVTYRYPTPLPNGAVYVVGLESTSGSVGADGPVWRVGP